MSTWLPIPGMCQRHPHSSLGVSSREQHSQHGSRSIALVLCFTVLAGLGSHTSCRGRVCGHHSNDYHFKTYQLILVVNNVGGVTC